MAEIVTDEEKKTESYNDMKRREKLERQITRAHEWRVQVWAQSELKIRAAAASLEVLGAPVPDMFEPEFDNDEMLHHYSTMPLSK